MPPEIKDNLFKLDKIGTRDGTNNEKGTGLGLLIAAEMMQKMGGTIEIESEPGKGSTFSLILPNGKAEN
jgi:signal transduction histidine kinase